MHIAYIVITAILAAYLAFSAVADFVRFHKVLEAMAKANVPEGWLPLLGAVKAAAVLGLAAGVVVPAIGFAAAIGVIVFFIGAVVTHIRARYFSFAAPLSFLLLAVGGPGRNAGCALARAREFPACVGVLRVSAGGRGMPPR